MSRTEVPAFDLLPATLRRRFAWRRHLATLALAFLCGLAIAWLELAERREQVQESAEGLARQQRELERLQAELAAMEQREQARQLARAQHMQLEQQQAQWGLAAQTLRAVAHPLGSVPGAQLLELRIDEQGLQLVGEIEPARMQPWLETVRQRSQLWGEPELVEIAPSGRGSQTAARPSELQRFVARFGRVQAAPPGGGSP